MKRLRRCDPGYWQPLATLLCDRRTRAHYAIEVGHEAGWSFRETHEAIDVFRYGDDPVTCSA
jgi:hypothetical protein